MNGQENNQQDLSCTVCTSTLQEYLDGTLEKTQSLRVFLHLRDCAACKQEHDDLLLMFRMLDGLPAVEPPADFDAPILASVPYAAYKAMEPLRRERVPVFLEENALPAAVRSVITRVAGLVLAAGAGAGLFFLNGPDVLGAVAILGLLPEAAVRLQAVGRSAVLAVRRTES
ncbi:MAG: zf-HC2 domain-containing protein [bacterium]